jgi:hypothetical protein
MLYQPSVTDASFVEGRAPEDIRDVLRWAREHLGLDGRCTWRLISARRRFGKTLFEIEEKRNGETRRLIGKVCGRERAEHLYKTLVLLRNAGFHPPARFTVPAAIALIAERGFVLQEKAPGQPASDLLGESGATDSALWLAALHRTGMSAPGYIDPSGVVASWAEELANAEPGIEKTVRRIADAAVRTISGPVQHLVPSHGDFHAMNLLVTRERITAIDIDKFGQAPPEFDVGYFLMQAAAFDFFKTGSLHRENSARQRFFEAYQAESGRTMRRELVAACIAMAFLKNLHFELVLLNTGNSSYVAPWLWGAESALFKRNIFLTA